VIRRQRMEGTIKSYQDKVRPRRTWADRREKGSEREGRASPHTQYRQHSERASKGFAPSCLTVWR
jgi:hypothetical protein